MKKTSENTSKARLDSRISFMHSSSAKAFVTDKSREEGVDDSVMLRRIYNKGLETLYGVKVIGNKVENAAR